MKDYGLFMTPETTPTMLPSVPTTTFNGIRE